MTSDFELQKKFGAQDLIASNFFDNGLLLIEEIHKV